MCCDRSMTVPSHRPGDSARRRRTAGRRGRGIRRCASGRGVRGGSGRCRCGRQQEHADGPGHRGRHRDRGVVAPAAGRGAARRSGSRRGGRRPARQRSPRRRRHLGARPDRRDGQLRLRHPRLLGFGGRAGGRCVGGRCGRRRRHGRGVFGRAWAGRARAGPRPSAADCAAPTSASCRWRWWARDSGTRAARRAAQAALLAGLLPVVRDVRRIGSAALDLCMVAAGRLDAHYEHGLNVWDWAAGALIAAEAGARVHVAAAGRSRRRLW